MTLWEPQLGQISFDIADHGESSYLYPYIWRTTQMRSHAGCLTHLCQTLDFSLDPNFFSTVDQGFQGILCLKNELSSENVKSLTGQRLEALVSGSQDRTSLIDTHD
jgi:hypothetical protein